MTNDGKTAQAHGQLQRGVMQKVLLAFPFLANIYWTDARVDRWIRDHLPATGCIGYKWFLRRGQAAGIPEGDLKKALRRVPHWSWDGDGHHLPVIARQIGEIRTAKHPDANPHRHDPASA